MFANARKLHIKPLVRVAEMLREMAEKRGLDLHKISREEYVEVRRKERENVANEDID